MGAFEYAGGRLRCEELDVEAIARTVGTPFYLYSASALRARLRAVHAAFSPLEPTVCFAIKACPNLAILRLLVAEGAGFDVVSEGELHRALAAGVDPSRVVFAGVGKTDREIGAALDAGVAHLNVESPSELDAVDRVAAGRECTARVLLRVNPDVDAESHPHISTGRHADKFGVDVDEALSLVRQRARFEHVAIEGFHVHIGSQITSPAPFERALDRLEPLIAAARADGLAVETLDLGGGFGIGYRAEAPGLRALVAPLLPRVQALGCRVVVEPGRYIAGPAGALVTEITYVKRRGDRRFVITDAGMTELIRPALYEAWHEVRPVAAPLEGARTFRADIVGPICETADFLALDREVPALARGDLLAVMDAGAYGASMGSNYNARPKPPEVLVDGERFEVVRRRETLDDLLRLER